MRFDSDTLNRGEPGTGQPRRLVEAPERLLAQRVARIIHDRVLQSLGVAMLQADLCRRLWRAGRDQEAMAELEGALAGLDTALDELRAVMSELRGRDHTLPLTA